LWKKLETFRDEWSKQGNILHRIPGTNYIDKQNVLNDFIKTNRINLSGSGFRNTKRGVLGELGCFNGHYDCWKYIVENKLESCLVIEDGIEILRKDYNNIVFDKKLDILFVNEEMIQSHENQFIGYGTQGYILSLKGAETLLKLCFTLSLPIDLQIRHLCNTHQLNASVLSKPLVRRDHHRVSSIEGAIMNDQEDLNAKQNQFNIVQRIIIGLLEKNVNIDDYL
jgi:GR25 family glycosyltransferase involved in LPS biosynthesis